MRQAGKVLSELLNEQHCNSKTSGSEPGLHMAWYTELRDVNVVRNAKRTVALPMEHLYTHCSGTEHGSLSRKVTFLDLLTSRIWRQRTLVQKLVHEPPLVSHK